MPLRDALVRMIETAGTLPADMATKLGALADWDGRFDCDSLGAPLYVFTLHELGRHVWGALLGKEIAHRFLSTRRSTPRLQRVLLDDGDPLRGDIERAAGAPLASLVAAAFAKATRRLTRDRGPDLSAWTWGAVQRLRLSTLFGEVPIVGRYFTALDAAFSGDVYTVSPAISVPMGGGMRPLAGATSRFICDLAKPDEALFAHTSGPSGDPGSTYFGSLTQGWYRFEYFRSALWPAGAVPNVSERVVVEAKGLRARPTMTSPQRRRGAERN